MADRCGFRWPRDEAAHPALIPHECRLDDDHPTDHTCTCGATHDEISEGP